MQTIDVVRHALQICKHDQFDFISSAIYRPLHDPQQSPSITLYLYLLLDLLSIRLAFRQ